MPRRNRGRAVRQADRKPLSRTYCENLETSLAKAFRVAAKRDARMLRKSLGQQETAGVSAPTVSTTTTRVGRADGCNTDSR